MFLQHDIPVGLCCHSSVTLGSCLLQPSNVVNVADLTPEQAENAVGASFRGVTVSLSLFYLQCCTAACARVCVCVVEGEVL